MEQVNLKPAGGGPSRGGVGGPCDHCARTSSPCWRKGPPEKPLLCNACGAHYLVKKSLEGYKPGQKQARPTGSSPARPRSRPKKKPATVDPPTPDSPFASSAGGSAKKGAAGEGSAATNKRQRKANKKYLAGEGEGAESEEGNATQRSSISHRKPKGLTIRRVSRQDSMAEIVDTPMAANLLADMADRRKNQAPPPVWELTSPRGIEGARQRTFNALMCSPRSNRRMSSDGMEANAAVCPPPAPQHQHHQQNQPPLSPSMPVPHANGSAILAEHPYAKRTVLYSYDTPLGLIEMTDVVNGKTWRAISTLAHSEASALSTLLPECDRSVEPGTSHAGVSSDLFKSAAFQSAMSNFQNLLSSGMFDREGPNAGGSKVVDHFRRLHTETNLSASNWRETMPLVGKRRRAAKKRAADEYQALLAAKQSGTTSTSSASPAPAPISAPEAQPPVDLPPSPHSLTTAVPILRGEAAVVAAPLIQRPAFHPAAPSALTPEASFLNAEPKPEAGTFGDGMPPGLNSAAPLRSSAAGQSSATVPSPTTPVGGGEPPHPQQQQRQQQGSEAKTSSANLARMGSDLLCST